MRLLKSQSIGNWLMACAVFVIGHHLIPSKNQNTEYATLTESLGQVDWGSEWDVANINQKAKRKDTDARIRYINQYAPLAKAEMKAYQVPASIKLAQGLLESNAGKSSLATVNKNHFGIKCFSKRCKKGHCTNHSDDTHKDFFLRYNQVAESYRAHSRLLQNPRYVHLKKAGSNYRKWAHGLARAGYATDKRYAQKLIRIIEELRLDRFDS